MPVYLVGLVHRPPCGGVVVPALSVEATEEHLWEAINGALPVCLKCGKDAPSADLRAQYSWMTGLEGCTEEVD